MTVVGRYGRRTGRPSNGGDGIRRSHSGAGSGVDESHSIGHRGHRQAHRIHPRRRHRCRRRRHHAVDGRRDGGTSDDTIPVHIPRHCGDDDYEEQYPQPRHASLLLLNANLRHGFTLPLVVTLAIVSRPAHTNRSTHTEVGARRATAGQPKPLARGRPSGRHSRRCQSQAGRTRPDFCHGGHS